MERFVNNNKIEIHVTSNCSGLEHFIRDWNANEDIYFCSEWNQNDQEEYSAYSKHIENLKIESNLTKRIISLNLLVNGAIFISTKTNSFSIDFIKYHIKDVKLRHSITSDLYGSFYTNIIEEYPFEKNEEFYLENKGLPDTGNFDCLLFGISKFDFVIRVLLFQAGLISVNNFNEKVATWNTLYKMIDTMRFGCRESGLNFDNIVDKSSLEKFTASCNSPMVLGINSRHGGQGNEIPESKHIKDIDEAISLILSFAYSFTKEYVVKKSYINLI